MTGKLTGIVFANDCRTSESIAAWERKGNLRIYFAYEQKCMSVLMSAVYNSNFEKKWIYAHHISTFTNDFLYIYPLEKYSEYVVGKKCENMMADFDKLLSSVQYQSVADERITDENRYKLTNLRDGIQPKEDDSKIYDVINHADKNNLAITNNAIRELLQLCNISPSKFSYYSEDFYVILKKCCLDESGLICLSDNTIKAMQKVIEKHKGPEFEYYFSDWTPQEMKSLRDWLRPADAPKGCNYMVLSDAIVEISEPRKEFWQLLKEKYHFLL